MTFPQTISNFKYGWLSGKTRNNHEYWSNVLGICAFALIIIGIVYLELRLNHVIGG